MDLQHTRFCMFQNATLYRSYYYAPTKRFMSFLPYYTYDFCLYEQRIALKIKGSTTQLITTTIAGRTEII